MPTEKQIAAVLKREQTLQKKGIIAEVTEAALHIINDSYLKETALWPKDGVVVHSTGNFELKDVIDVQVFIKYNDDCTVTQKLRINIFGKKEARVEKQADQIELIIDQTNYGPFHFAYVRTGFIGVGFDTTWSNVEFQFTINK